MYRKEILDNIQVSDSEAWKEFKRENIKVHLRHLYAPTREQAEKYYHELKNGATFAQLAREAFKDTVLSKNGGDLGYVGIDDLDPMLADSVYQQRIGVFSHPLRSGFGYHIVRVEDIQQNIFLTREDFEMRKESLKNAVRRRRAQVFSRRYLARVLKGKSLHIKSAVLNRLVGDIGKTLPAPKAESPLAHPSVSDADIDRLDDSLEKFSRATLVEFNGESWSVAEYLRRLKKIPPLQRPVIQNRQQLIKNIIDMARDELLLEIAYRKGYQRSGEVKKAVRRWRNELLADEFWKRIHWVQYQKLDPQEWRRRKEIYEKFKRTVPVSINEKNLFQDVPEKKLLEKQVPLPTVIRNAYVW